MVFKREICSLFPREYERWESNGIKWVVQDLPPEDDEKALEIFRSDFCDDEVLCSTSGISRNPKSFQGILDFWRHCITQRTSLACYAEENGVRTLVAVNVCVPAQKVEEDNSVEIVGEEWQNVYHSLEYIETKCNPFEFLNLDVLLGAYGLLVKREYRGAKLGARLLNAREPLSNVLGIKATSTVFTGISSQKLATRCGFITIAEASLSEMAEAGLKYPKDDQRTIKLMVKKYK
ncbi:unnamed protein product [Parnassius apollo]|uniref:(apollo) hypothetical protein n=1 Tax=Parnassius apollo TaxID=110799 RepID=A0A8S3Y4S8_PARAO|nr:unnamed protein product [Parnassius apollo]